MNITIEIDELVLHGFPAADRYRIGEAVQAELARIIAERGPGQWRGDVTADRLDGGTFAVPAEMPATAVATGIAAAVYRSVTAVSGDQGEVR